MKKYTEDYLIGLATGIVLHSEIGESIDPKTNYEFHVELPTYDAWAPDQPDPICPTILICEWLIPSVESEELTSTDRGTEKTPVQLVEKRKHEILINKILDERVLVQVIEKELIPQLVAVKWEE